MPDRKRALLYAAMIAAIALLTGACGADQAGQGQTTVSGGDGDERSSSDLGVTDYPSQPIEVVIPYAPGGGQDRFARAISTTAGDYLGVPMVVRNIPGGAGTVGNAGVARNEDDPHKILFSNFGSMTLIPHLAEDATYSVDDFTPVVEVAEAPLVLVAGPDSPAKTLDEVIAYLHDNPGGLTFGTPGTGDSGHITFGGRLFEALGEDVEFTHVPFDGGAELNAALLGGHVDLISSTIPPIIEHLEAGTVSGVAVSAEERYESIPDVPSFGDLDVPEISVGEWRTFFVPAWVEDDVVDFLRDALVSTLEDEGFEALLDRLGEEAQIRTDGLDEKYARQWEENHAALVQMGLIDQ